MSQHSSFQTQQNSTYHRQQYEKKHLHLSRTIRIDSTSNTRDPNMQHRTSEILYTELMQILHNNEFTPRAFYTAQTLASRLTESNKALQDLILGLWIQIALKQRTADPTEKRFYDNLGAAIEDGLEKSPVYKQKLEKSLSWHELKIAAYTIPETPEPDHIHHLLTLLNTDPQAKTA
ncbi:MAG: hypothetical protein WCP97_08445 [bacterium]